MKKLMLVLFVLILSLSFAENRKGQSSSPEIQDQLVAIVSPLITGNFSEEQKNNFHPEAYIIYDNYYESAFEILSNNEKRKDFVDGVNVKYEFINIRLTDNLQNAYMVFSTNSNHWNSVLFEKNDKGNWQIISWHKS